MTTEVAIYFLLFLLSYAGTELFRRWVLKSGKLLDIPNERSSHNTATPRGAGVVFVTLCLLFLFSHAQENRKILWFLVGVLLVSVVSWLDDLMSLPAGVRFLAHLSASVVAVSALGGLTDVDIPVIGVINLGTYVGTFLTILWVTWFINAYNFMDGIDGIAGIQAFVASLGWIVVSVLFGWQENLLIAGSILAGVSGFLLHNLPPAKVFMGDVGSAFLGYSFAVLPLMVEETTKPRALLLGVSFVFLFVFDSVFTLFRRIIRGEEFWKAHRSHIYQRLVISGLSHAQVTTIYGFLSLLNIFSTTVFFLRDNYAFLLTIPTSALCVFVLLKHFERKSRERLSS